MSLLDSVKSIAAATGRQAGETAYSTASTRVLSAVGMAPGEDAASNAGASAGATSGVGPSPVSEAAGVGGRSYSVSSIIDYAKANPVKAGGIALAIGAALWFAFKKKK